MRKRKTVKIDKREVTVHELTVAQILDVADQLTSATRDIDELLPYAVDVSLNDLKEMAPSEIKEIYEAFKEINADFFDVALALGLGTLLERLKNSIVADFLEEFAGSLKQDIQGPLATDTPSS